MLGPPCLVPPARLLMSIRLFSDLRQRPEQAETSVWLRLMLCALCCCIGLQAIALAAHHAQGRTHFHIERVKPGLALTEVPALHDTPHRHPAVVDHGALFRHKSSLRPDHVAETAPAPHRSHIGLADHAHDAADASVVYVAQDDRLPGFGAQAALSPIVHDLDSLLPACVPLPPQPSTDRWPPFASAAIVSHVTQPLERPPQA